MRLLYVLTLGTALSLLTRGGPPQAKADSETLKALDAAQQAVRAGPESENNRLQAASLYLKIGQNTRAIEILQGYLESHAESPKSQCMLAVAYLREDEYTLAKDAAEHALRIAKADSACVQVLGMSYLGLHDTAAAERSFRQAMQLDPNSVEAKLQLGLLYTNGRKNLQEAIGLLEKARTLAPNLAATYTALGSAYLAAGDAKAASTSLEIAVRLAPGSAESYYALAAAYRQLDQPDKAETALAAFNAQKRADADRRAREMRSRAEYEEGVNLLSNTDQLDKAYEALARAVSELPTFDPGYYRMAQVSYLKGDLQKALGSIRKALTLNPFEPEYYYVLARCLEDSDLPGALNAIQRATAFRPGVPDFEALLRDLQTKAAAKPPA